MAARVTAARLAQAERWGPVVGARSPVNADVPGLGAAGRAMALPPAATATLDRALETGSLSLRGYDRSLRVAWTIADLARAARPEREQVDLALSLRHRPGVGRGVRPGDRWARAALSRLAEPSDAEVHGLVASVGAARDGAPHP